jgi:hypothetical protein
MLSIRHQLLLSSHSKIVTYLRYQTLALQTHILPKQLSTGLNSIAEHVHQAETVGKWLHVGIPSVVCC